MAFSLPGFIQNPNPGVPPGKSFPQFSPPTDRAIAKQPLKEVPQNPASGSLVIVDSFQDSSYEADHGNVAAFAAKQHGFRGQIYAEQIGSPNQAGLTESGKTYNLLGSRPLEPAKTRQAVQDYARHDQRELLEDVTGDLNKIRERGLKDSAVNVSYGTNPQRIADRLYRDIQSAPRQDPGVASGSGMAAAFVAMNSGGREKYQLAQNVFRAYDIDQAKVYHADPKVSGPERLKLQQSLLNAAQAGGKAPDVQAAKATYGEAVKKLEANNNSVVVSAGNDGHVLGDFAAEANGARVKASPDSGDNVLTNPDVTTVGSTRWYNSGTERIAKYNSTDSEIDIYASGSVGNGRDQSQMKVMGTSFASPRTAGAMAALHGNHPGMPSSSVENLMKNRLTHETEGKKVLDFGLAEEYMRRGTF